MAPDEAAVSPSGHLAPALGCLAEGEGGDVRGKNQTAFPPRHLGQRTGDRINQLGECRASAGLAIAGIEPLDLAVGGRRARGLRLVVEIEELAPVKNPTMFRLKVILSSSRTEPVFIGKAADN